MIPVAAGTFQVRQLALPLPFSRPDQAQRGAPKPNSQRTTSWLYHDMLTGAFKINNKRGQLWPPQFEAYCHDARGMDL